MAFPQYNTDTSSYVMTSLPELQQLLSTRGERSASDDLDILSENHDPLNDDDASRTNMLTEYIQRVTSQIMEYLSPKFAVADVYKLPRLREIATYWLAYKITGRRGNEPLYTAQYIEGLETLERYREGSLFLAAPTYGPRAYMQSGIVDLRASYQPWRILPFASSNIIPNQSAYTPYCWYGFNWL